MKQISKSWKELLLLIYQRTWVSALDICVLFYPNLKYARRMTCEMINRNFIKRVQCSIFEGERGPGMNFYSLTSAGHKIVIANDPNFEPSKNPTSTNLLHYFIINIFLTGLRLLEKDHSGVTIQTISQRQLQTHNLFFEYCLENRVVHEEPSLFIPDFVFVLGDGQTKHLYIGEVDACTETIESKSSIIKSVAKKFELFSSFFQCRHYLFFNQLFSFDFSDCSYLFVTAGNDLRVSHIHSCAKKLNQEIQRKIFIAKVKDILPNKKLDHGRLLTSFDNLVMPVFICAEDDIGDAQRHSIVE